MSGAHDRFVVTVTQLNEYVKSLMGADPLLRSLSLKGEISNFKRHSSGHLYFSLKDESGTISCVMFASARKGLAFGMKNGQQVLVLGNISVYERDGTYQLYASRILLDGAGLLYEKFEALKAELEEMGMFDPVYKKPIPPFVKKLGVVTAPPLCGISFRFPEDAIRVFRSSSIRHWCRAKVPQKVWQKALPCWMRMALM